MIKHITWNEIKSLVSLRNAELQYEEHTNKYDIFIETGRLTYIIELWRITDESVITGIDITQNNLDLTEFLADYKDSANKPLAQADSDGRPFIRAESKPLGTTTVFTMVGDDIGISDGKELVWDFSNDNDNVEIPPAGTKKKRLEFKFIDPVYIKEGTIYFHNAKKGSYIDFYVVCPTGNYYIANDGTLKLAVTDVIIDNFVAKHRIQGTVALGDELNTETISNQIPSSYKFWIDITAPDADIDSNGYVSLELYRARTRVL